MVNQIVESKIFHKRCLTGHHIAGYRIFVGFIVFQKVGKR